MSESRTALDAALTGYARRYPDAAEVAVFREFLTQHAAVFQRSHGVGHFTGSAWLVSGDGRRVLLTHHRKLARWLQLGGHADGDEDLARVALREAQEESGLHGLEVEAPIFDLDRHWIPARGSEAGHWHYDVRHVVHARGDERYAVSEESLELGWFDIAALAVNSEADESLRRMAKKWLARAKN